MPGNYRYELKKQISKPTLNSNRKQNCTSDVLESPSVDEILMIEEYIRILRIHQGQTDTNQPTETQPKENKGKSKVKIPGKVEKQYKKHRKAQVKTPTRPIQFHSIFDNNLLRPNGGKLGCECTALSGSDYGNPFFEDIFEKLTYKTFTVLCALVQNNAVRKAHLITFRPIEEFRHIITTMSPTLYMSEYVTGTQAAIGITYSLMIRLAKDNIFVVEHVVKHTFTEAATKLMEIRIFEYPDFDTIYYYHIISDKPEVPLNVEKVLSIKIGKSVFMILSKTIKWTKTDVPKVVVESADQVGNQFY